jgi:hypothetical protein
MDYESNAKAEKQGTDWDAHTKEINSAPLLLGT